MIIFIALLLLLLGISFCLIAHSYVFFPAILSCLAARLKTVPQESPDEFQLPEVDILLAAHNEERVIAEKVRSTFASSYPAEKINLYIGSDNSSDGTNEILSKLAGENDRVHFREFPQRTGKIGVIEVLAASSRAPIIILTDANVFFDNETIPNLVKRFADPTIGLVGGNILNAEVRRSGISVQEKAYLQRENVIKEQEGRLWGAMIGAFGGCYALRRKNYHPAPRSFLVDDFYISMAVIRDGLKAVMALDAICYEDVSDHISEEFRRKARISAGNYQNLTEFRRMLWPPWSGVAFAFWSHKVIRWFTPHLILFMLAASLVIVTLRPGWPSGLLVAFQLCPFLSMLVDAGLRRLGVHSSLLRFVTHFYSMNAALLVGHVRYLRGVRTTVWAPTQRYQQSA